jgi:hypothetical protein
MEKINLKYFAVASFSIFIINMFKYYLINIKNLLSPYGSENRLISLIMLPIIGIGMCMSIFVLFKTFKSKINLINIVLSIPLIIFFIYFFFIKK